MKYDHCTIEDLQRLSRGGDEVAMKELGERIMWMNIIDDNYHECQYRDELDELKQDMAVPPDCPHCGKWLTDK